MCCVFVCTSAYECFLCIVLNGECGDVGALGILGWGVSVSCGVLCFGSVIFGVKSVWCCVVCVKFWCLGAYVRVL